MRFISYGEIQELFFDLVELERADGAHIAEAIVQSLKSNNISILKCRGQAYDGASAMASEKVGVQARICTISPLALYTQCRSHVLNLSIAVLHLHNDVPIDVDEVCQLFVTKNNRRSFQSCIFYD